MLGKRLRVTRKERGYSLEELARKTGFSKSFLSQIENNKNSPSIASLKRITQALAISMGELFDEKKKPQQVFFLKRDQRRTFEVAGDHATFEFGAAGLPNRKMEPFFFSLQPGATSHELSSHEGEEFGTVVEGTLLFELDGEPYPMEAGDSIYFRSNVPHRWSNPGTQTMRAIWVVTPPSF